MNDKVLFVSFIIDNYSSDKGHLRLYSMQNAECTIGLRGSELDTGWDIFRKKI